MNKSEIRKKILKKRNQNNNKNLNINFKAILKVLKKHTVKGKILGGYYPYNNEIDVIEILKKLEKSNYHICLPRIKKKYQMDFFPWSSKDPLIINEYGIPEPISNNVKYPDVLFVPLVAYDNHNNRIGYGGGFYDRYINKIRKNKIITTIGIAYSFQKVKKIPTNKHDIKLDFIITER